MSWHFPLFNWDGSIPTGNHPGAFGSVRKHDVHTGVDLYVPASCLVYAFESGTVVAIEEFTGPEAESPWWLPTQAILVEGPTGVVCYGEVVAINLDVGDKVSQGQILAYVSPVLPEGKERPDIPGHSRFMLHFELYQRGTRETVWWYKDEPKPKNLKDPTDYLLEACESNDIWT